MTIVRVGTNQKFAAGWERAFGGSGPGSAGKSKAAKPALKSAKKKAPPAKKTAKKSKKTS